MSLTIKKYILISDIDKHQVKCIAPLALFHEGYEGVFLRGMKLRLYVSGIFTKKFWCGFIKE